jgi:hypothetical protein
MTLLASLSARLGRRAKPTPQDDARPAAEDPSRNPDWIILPPARLREEDDEPPSQAQIDRKLRSEARLRALGLPTYSWIPEVMGEETARLRELGEIVDRSAALWHCGFKARILLQGTTPEEEQEECDTLLRHEIAQVFSADERRFIADPHPDRVELAQYVWRLDGLCVLFWAMRMWDGPIGPPYAPPDTAVGSDAVIEVIRSEPEPQLRPIGEILDLYDLTSRCFWPSSYFHFNGKPQPPGFNRDVLIEHHHVLEWLISASEWDDWMDGKGSEGERLTTSDRRAGAGIARRRR